MTELDTPTIASAARAFGDLFRGLADQMDALAAFADSLPATITVPDSLVDPAPVPFAVGRQVVASNHPGERHEDIGPDDDRPVGTVTARMETLGELHTVVVLWPTGFRASYSPAELVEL